MISYLRIQQSIKFANLEPEGGYDHEQRDLHFETIIVPYFTKIIITVVYFFDFIEECLYHFINKPMSYTYWYINENNGVS